MSQPFSARRLLLPLVPLYRLALAFRELRLRFGLEPVRRLRWPVVSIGNLSTGGSGKTPLTIALAKALTARGLRVDVLSRGYGRQSQLAARVNPERNRRRVRRRAAADCPRDRRSGLRGSAALRCRTAGRGRGAANRRRRSASRSSTCSTTAFSIANSPATWTFCCSIAATGRTGCCRRAICASRSVPPAAPASSPFRPTSRSWKPNCEAWGWQGPVWRLRRTMEIPAVDGPVAAFCGIARPEQFFAGLEAAGLRTCSPAAPSPTTTATPPATSNDLAAAARAAGATALITTEKDLVRLGELASQLPAISAAQDRPPAHRDRGPGRRHRLAAWPARLRPSAPALVRKSEFADAVQLSLACGPAGRHGRHSARPSGGDGAAAGPSRLGDRLGRRAALAGAAGG